MAKVIVYVSGGNVQGVISDTPGTEVMIVDYDNEECDLHPEREFFEAPLQPALFARTLAGTESAYDWTFAP